MLYTQLKSPRENPSNPCCKYYEIVSPAQILSASWLQKDMLVKKRRRHINTSVTILELTDQRKNFNIPHTTKRRSLRTNSTT